MLSSINKDFIIIIILLYYISISIFIFTSLKCTNNMPNSLINSKFRLHAVLFLHLMIFIIIISLLIIILFQSTEETFGQ